VVTGIGDNSNGVVGGNRYNGDNANNDGVDYLLVSIVYLYFI
jgi:hypothetical protein